MSRQRLTIVCENYWPEHGSTAQLITALAEGLTPWFEVEVIASQPRYQGSYGRYPALQAHNGVSIRRVWSTGFDKGRKLGRMANWLSFGASALWSVATTWQRTTYLFVTNPPTAPWAAIAARLTRRRSFVLVHDLYPDLAQALKVLNRESRLARLFNRLNIVALRSATGVVALGVDMRERLRAKLGPNARIEIIPNWADGELIAPRQKPASAFAWSNALLDKTVFLYAGNLGLFQDLQVLIDAIERLDDSNVRLVFVGDGGKRAVVEAAARRSERVMLFDYLPYSQVGDLYAAADVGLIAIEPGVEMTNMPSKTYSLLAAGKPFIAVTGGSKELRRLADEGAGIVVSNDVGEVAEAMAELHGDKATRTAMGAQARRIFEERYTLQTAVERYRLLLSGKKAMVPPVEALTMEPKSQNTRTGRPAALQEQGGNVHRGRDAAQETAELAETA